MLTKYDIKNSKISQLTEFKDYDSEFEDTLQDSLKVILEYQAMTLEDTTFLVFKESTYKIIFTSLQRQYYKDDMRLKILKKVPFLKHFPDILLNKLVNCCKIIKFR